LNRNAKNLAVTNDVVVTNHAVVTIVVMDGGACRNGSNCQHRNAKDSEKNFLHGWNLRNETTESFERVRGIFSEELSQ
jgi:hypothetical protein